MKKKTKVKVEKKEMPEKAVKRAVRQKEVLTPLPTLSDIIVTLGTVVKRVEDNSHLVAVLSEQQEQIVNSLNDIAEIMTAEEEPEEEVEKKEEPEVKKEVKEELGEEWVTILLDPAVSGHKRQLVNMRTGEVKYED